MQENDWLLLQRAVLDRGFEAGDRPDDKDELHLHLAQVNNISHREALEWFAGLFQILPLDLARTSISVQAESVFRKLAVPTAASEPWVPMGNVGPLLIFAHYNPACQQYWSVPGEFCIPILIPTSKYRLLLDDITDRLILRPLADNKPIRFSTPLPVNGSYEQVLDWLFQEYPFDDTAETRSRLDHEIGKGDSQAYDISRLRNLSRGLGPALHHLATGDPCFNAECAPPQTLFPESLLEKHGVYPMFCGSKVIYLLSADRNDFAFEDEWLSSGNDTYAFRTVYAEKAVIQSTIQRERGRTVSIGNEASTDELTYSDAANIVDIDVNDVQRINPSSINATSEQILHWVLYRTIVGRASDLHIEKYFNMARFRARIDGEMKVIYSCSEEMLPRFISLIKNYANMGQRRQDAQDARFSLILGKRRIDCRVSAIPCRKDLQKITIRFLDKQDGVKKLTELNLSPRQNGLLAEAMGRDQGLILVTGPTGSGKTTTLYALLNSINSENINIHTIEDPIEYEIEGINQTQTDAVNNLDFAEGLRRLMRADPDVILIGECRDNETASAAITAALTGHLVLTTLHANDSLRAVSRLISMGVPSYLLADSLALTQAQRLVRRLCPFCKKAISLTPAITRIFDANLIPVNPDARVIYSHQGCPECNDTGYSGRLALMELSGINNELSDLIACNAPQSQMRRLATQQGMLSLYQEGLVQVLAGSTTMEEISCLSYTAVDSRGADEPPPDGKIVGMPMGTDGPIPHMSN